MNGYNANSAGVTASDPLADLVEPVCNAGITVGAVQSLGANRATILEAIHRFRGISMHPELNAEIRFEDQSAFAAWAHQSARVRLSIEILDKIRDKGEKALLFLEYKAAQRIIAEWFKPTWRVYFSVNKAFRVSC